MDYLPDKWTAFWLSLLVPGAGQLAARSWTAPLWLGTAISFALVFGIGDSNGIDPFDPFRLAAICAIGLLSAEHAKRLLEAPSRSASSNPTCLRRQVTWMGGSDRSIDVLMTLEFARPCGELWTVIADLPKFLIIDPFHDRAVVQRMPAAAGVDLVLSHNAFGLRFLRFGRIVAWNEGRGYTFSDLSRRNKKTGFPHVFVVAVAPAGCEGEARSMLTIRIRGRWTSKIVPRFIGRLWVTWVCREHARLLAKAL